MQHSNSFNIPKVFKKFLAFSFLFFLFYYEPLTINGISLSQLWKIPLFVFLIWNVFFIKKVHRDLFINFSYGRAFKNLINGGIFTKYQLEITDFVRYMMFPLLYEYFLRKIKVLRKLNHLLLSFAQFVIISGIPFIFFGVKSKGKILFNIENINSYTGIFQGPHAASISTSIAILVLLYFLKEYKYNVIYRTTNVLLIAFGIYLLFLTYVRTGYLMFIIGIIVLYFPTKITPKQMIIWTLIVIIIFCSIFILLQKNEFFYNRIFDIRNNHQTELGSGRFLFWQATLEIWANGNFFELLFGQGFDKFTDGIFYYTGLKVYAHNEFFTQLGQNGVLGVVIFISYIIYLFKFIIKRKKYKSFRLSLSVLFLYLSLMITQGGVWFPLDIFMALIFVKLEIEKKNYNFKNSVIGNMHHLV